MTRHPPRSSREGDFIWSSGRRNVGIEVTAASTWRRRKGSVLKELLDREAIQVGIGVYLGQEVLRDGAVRVLPFDVFGRELASGGLLVPPS